MKKNRKKMTNAMILTMALIFAAALPVQATSAVVAKINTLSELVLGIITAAGVIVLAWGIFEFATGYQGHDTSQQTASLKKVISGLIMVFAPQIIDTLK